MSDTFAPDDLRGFLDHGYDLLIDARSPSEYAEDHIPGAVNLPVLSDAERAEVGTLYKQVSPFVARKRGAALVARNVAAHVEGPLADYDGAFRPLVHCWRGGQRSGAFATILRQIGWRAGIVDGGYKRWRRLVTQALYEAEWPTPVAVLDGNTGTAKTDILLRAGALGAQVLDLEGLANHRGSVFGALGAQPAQKGFESQIAALLARFDPTRPVLVEAESSKVGARLVPPALWAAMQAAPRLTLEIPLEARARYLAEAYADVTADRAHLAEVIDSLRPFQPRDRIEAWQAMAQAREDAALAAALMRDHYDPRYARHRADAPAPRAVLRAPDLRPGARDELAQEIVTHLETLCS